MRTQASCYWQVGSVLLQTCRWPWPSRAIRRGTQEYGKPQGILGRGQQGLRSHAHTPEDIQPCESKISNDIVLQLIISNEIDNENR